MWISEPLGIYAHLFSFTFNIFMYCEIHATMFLRL
jgi:hypothetical protein